MKKIVLRLFLIGFCLFLASCSSKENLLTVEEVMQAFEENDLTFMTEEAYRNNRAKAYHIHGYLEEDKGQLFEIDIYDSERKARAAKKTNEKLANDNNLQGPGMKYYYVKNVAFLYIDDAISRGSGGVMGVGIPRDGTGVYETEIEVIIDDLKNADE